MRRAFLISALLVIATLTAYWPVRHAEFVNFDDPVYVTNNPEVFHGLTRQSFVWAFTHFHASNWHPLTWLSHMLDCQVFKDHAGAHHMVSVSIHACNALLLFSFLTRMTGAFWRSAWVAALFALHPLHVESVAWISERKDVLSTFFEFLALTAYVEYARRAGPLGASEFTPEAGGGNRLLPKFRPSVFYFLSIFLFALGLLSKAMLVTFPCLLLLVDYWPLRRFSGRISPPIVSSRSLAFRLLREKLPFFALAIAASVVTILAQSKGGAVLSLEKAPVGDRAANVVVSYLIYLEKTCWPTRLGVFYPFVGDLPSLTVALAVAVLLGVTAFAVANSRRSPYLVMGWLWFIGTLVPVIGLLQVGSQALADRYTYVPLVGLFIILAWGSADLLRRWQYREAVLVPLACGVVAGCLLVTWFQVQHWQNSLALFTRALAASSDENALAQHNLGHALASIGNQRDAITYFNESLRIRPGYAQAHFNRGTSLAVQGKLDEAVADFRNAIQYQPGYEQAYYHLASVLALQLKLDEARTNFLLALHYKSDYAEAHTKLGNLLLLEDKPSEALEHLQTAVRIRPDYDDGHYYLASALARQHRFEEAVPHFRAAVKCRPDYARALNDLAWILAAENEPKLHDAPEAARLATRACELTHYNNPMYLDTLGAAFSEAGRFAEAVRITERAVAAASTGEGDQAMASQIQKHLESFRQGVSYRDRLKAGKPQ